MIGKQNDQSRPYEGGLESKVLDLVETCLAKNRLSIAERKRIELERTTVGMTSDAQIDYPNPIYTIMATLSKSSRTSKLSRAFKHKTLQATDAFELSPRKGFAVGIYLFSLWW